MGVTGLPRELFDDVIGKEHAHQDWAKPALTIVCFGQDGDTNMQCYNLLQDLDHHSTSAWVFMPEQVAWDDVISVAMETVQEQMGVSSDMRFFPRRTQADEGGAARVTKSPADEVMLGQSN